MRVRTLLLVLATVAVVFFALLNWGEITRPVPLNLGWDTVTAPLPLVLLGLLALAVLLALASGAASHSRQRQLEGEHHKALQAQRDLADRAEASRFVDLRQALDTHLRETRQREAVSASAIDEALARTQREVRNQMELLHRSLNTRLGEMEARMEQRLERTVGPVPSPTQAPATYRPGLPEHRAVQEPDLRAAEPVRRP